MGLAGKGLIALSAATACLSSAGCATQPVAGAPPAAASTGAATTGAPSAGAPSAAAAASPTGSTPRLRVVAAENFWASLAEQLGGDHVAVSSVISNPATDPHDYEATPADARDVAGAQLFIQNGIGYDTSWAPKLVAANPAEGRQVITMGEVLGLADDANPHQWYSHDSVLKAIDAIVAAYSRLDPADAGWFGTQREAFLATALARYDELEGRIRTKYAGTPIGASESIVAPLAESLGLNLITPASFLTAISEGTDPSVADKTLIDQQIKNHLIKVYVYNTQNATPDIAAQVAQARAAGIPVSQVTETLSPADATFQDWMVSELAGLQTALAQGTGN